eukprot:maker-scaffold82_size396747-snap-gene-2.33 protein:Tk06832 transcript:maker-scaffold82_size396747-snap-gene-2.33-mRNA-1 annotation:"hypothetical protein SINV_00302"
MIFLSISNILLPNLSRNLDMFTLVKTCVVLLFIGEALARGRTSKTPNPDGGSSRTGKLFSLFNVLTFRNDICDTSSSLSGGSTEFRTGTCYTTSECESRGGRSTGLCAAGFGVCCLFTTSECGGSIVHNNTYVRNPGFPNEIDDPTDCNYQVERTQEDICQLRLDFESFSIAGPPLVPDSELDSTDIHEVNGGECLIDVFTVEGLSTGAVIPEICGMNSGQHMYIDVGTNGKSAATLSFNFLRNSNTDREWEIKVAQIPCRSNFKAPPDCLQYFTGSMGKIKTFNFDDPATSHLANQKYSACIRQELGHCCVKYTVCDNVDSAFTLSTEEEEARTDADCLLDYIGIQGGSQACEKLPSVSANKFCGQKLAAVDNEENGIVCTCSAPFAITINTDGLADDEDVDGTNDVNSRGACLRYRQ